MILHIPYWKPLVMLITLEYIHVITIPFTSLGMLKEKKARVKQDKDSDMLQSVSEFSGNDPFSKPVFDLLCSAHLATDYYSESIIPYINT